MPNVILEFVNRTNGQVVAGFFFISGSDAARPNTARADATIGGRKDCLATASPSDGVYLTQIATQPPPRRKPGKTNEVEEDIDEGVQEGEEDKDDAVAVTTIVDVAEDEDEDEAPPVLEPARKGFRNGV